jgi:hypothetical protein
MSGPIYARAGVTAAVVEHAPTRDRTVRAMRRGDECMHVKRLRLYSDFFIQKTKAAACIAATSIIVHR